MISRYRDTDRCALTCDCDHARCATPVKDRVGNIDSGLNTEENSTEIWWARSGKERVAYHVTEIMATTTIVTRRKLPCIAGK